MAQIVGRATLSLRVLFELSEQEAGALNALIGYGIDPFLKVFYEHMGKAYMEPYEAGLRSLFESRGSLLSLIHRADKARKVFSGELVATYPKSDRASGETGKEGV